MGVYKIKNLKVSEHTDKLFVTEYDKEGYILRRYWIKREDLIECEGEEDDSNTYEPTDFCSYGEREGE